MIKTTLPQAPVPRPAEPAEIVRLMAETLIAKHKHQQKTIREEPKLRYLRSCGWSSSEIYEHFPAALREFVRLVAARVGERA